MRKLSPIILLFLSLLAATALIFSSCNVSKKGGSRRKTVPVEITPPPVTGSYDQPQETAEDAPAETDPQAGFEASATETTDYMELEGDGTDSEEIPVAGQEKLPGDPESGEVPAEDIPWDEEIPSEQESPAEEEFPSKEEDGDRDPLIKEASRTDSIPSLFPDDGYELSEGAEDGEDKPEEDSEDESDGDGPAMKVIEFEADIMRNIHITDDSTATNLLGNVVMYHNGAVITCDSAVRYSENRMDFFKRVIINNGTTYVYGDRATYNGETNIARVFAPIVKTVDEDAVLYTYNFIFNTQTGVGRFSGGGVFTREDNRMESDRGWYNTDTREFTGAGDVELVNPDYKMISDSVRYNLDTEIAEFFVRSYIWNNKGEILIADRGKYRNSHSDYEFTQNSYILTDDQEIWADSMRHFSEEDLTILRRDIQIIDEENNTMAFGDYGEYWGETEHGMLTLDPALVNYDPEEPADTLYMRSDSMFFYTYDYDHVFAGQEEPSSRPDEIPMEELIGAASVEPGTPPEFPPIFDDGAGLLPTVTDPSEPAVFDKESEELTPEQESLTDMEIEQIEVEVDEGYYEQPPLSDKQQRRQQKAEQRTARRESKKYPSAGEEENETENIPGDHDTDSSEEIIEYEETEEITEDTPPDEGEETEPVIPEPYVSRFAELATILQDLMAADSTEKELTHTDFWHHVGAGIEADSTRLEEYMQILDGVIATNEPDISGVEVPEGNSRDIIVTLTDEAVAEAESLRVIAEGTQQEDSVQRVFYGYRDVRIYREDFQAVCDSIVGFSKDSTMHLHIDPVMWSDDNQVTSDIMVIYTRDEQLYKADFSGSPFMASQVDSTRYNQIKGRAMTAWFRDNTIYRHDVFGNGQNFYYMEDEKTGDIDAFMTVECADITYYIEDNTIDEIVWRVDPVYFIYPIDKIPPEVDEFLPGFKWEASRRPLRKEDVFNRIVRERRREEVLALPLPQFPIAGEMEAAKQRLTEQNLWRDRNDRLSPQALEFIQYIELKNAEAELEEQ